MQQYEQTDASFSCHKKKKKKSHITVNTDVPWYSVSPSVTMARVETSQTLSAKQILHTATTKLKQGWKL